MRNILFVDSVKDFEMKIKNLISDVKANKRIQGHFCVLNNELFDGTIKNEIYGFPGTVYNTRQINFWRAVSSLYNIGRNDIIFFYRTSGNNPGAQEFHGAFTVNTYKDDPLLLIHFDDESYLPQLMGKKRTKKYLKFRFLLKDLLPSPISIKNDLGLGRTKKNHNLRIIQALTEKNPNNDRLWGFRHPTVMNIGAARKKSIVALSQKQTLFLLNLLLGGKIRKLPPNIEKYIEYDFSHLPDKCELLNAEFLSKHLSNYITNNKFKLKYESELYAYIIHSIKNQNSPYYRRIIEDFKKINDDIISFENVCENVILETILTVHMQEEIDILLCDSQEENFLILEIKNDVLTNDDIEQAEKYIDILGWQFPDRKEIKANLIGLEGKDIKSTGNVKIVSYKIEKFDESLVGISFN